METLTYPPSAAATLCTTTSLVPAKGFLAMTDAPSSVVYEVPCQTSNPLGAAAVIAAEQRPDTHDSSSDTRFSDFRDPFYASTFPICYALAAATVTAYMLLIMLFITPRSFLDGGVVYLGRRRGFTHSSSGGENIGGRPWLQKVAALTVAVSLTIATHDTFKVAQRQYQWGAQNAGVLQSAVMGSTELRVIRLISNTFLWLAQAQTLIRLFPRHREKVIIKWAAFALITLDLIFSALNSFNDRYPNPMGGSFDHPIPALSYLFQLLLGVLYAAWVIYYSLMKKRYAFYHPLMKNMPLLAIISLTSILIPVVFFIMDISKPEFTGWGDYVRWVGAAAASVIVWEWVERIEALEREEKKDGILGREVFDGDDTLEVNASEFPWLRHRRHRKTGGDGESGGGGGDYHHYYYHHHHHHHHQNHYDGSLRSGSGWPTMTARQRTQPHTMGDILRPPLWPSRPAPTVTPLSRTDTPSAASTVYAVRYHGTSDTTSRSPEPDHPQPATQGVGGGVCDDEAISVSVDLTRPRRWRTLTLGTSLDDDEEGGVLGGSTEKETSEAVHRLATRDMVVTTDGQQKGGRDEEAGRWDIRSRLELFAANQAEKLREKLRPTADTESLPVTRIPAPPRVGTALRQVLEEDTMAAALAAAAAAAAAAEEEAEDDEEEDEMEGDEDEDEDDEDDMAVEEEVGIGSTTNPPLWPGVRRRVLAFEDESAYDSYDDEDSAAETASMESVEAEAEMDAEEEEEEEEETQEHGRDER
ncbi:hypothetical protein L249_1463 [Ophiocordyceps polyrhachis-furcata BCC 54312]|uniref:PH-response regulator protein palH/RIM21 n=1 Tax=Ophiocordyceps polyrhachis-furcata BCC 54312 TaxID=1330021 RepID=A0A367L441_9HYPO|nr:hypothetical protein L249_1463 [Ophiocordyceps polyrhachis-furcata BCC 54312]